DALADVVARSMEKEPGRRYQSAGELAGAAAEAIGTSASALRPASAPSRVRIGAGPGRRRWPWMAGAAAVVVLAVAVVLLASGGGGSQKEEKAAVAALIHSLVEGNHPSDCRRSFTANYLTTYYGRPYKQAL